MANISAQELAEEALHASQKMLRDFYREVLLRQEEEKKRISQDLHDESGQLAVALATSLNLIEKELKEGRLAAAQTVIEKNREMIKEIAGRMKSIALRLRPPALDVLGLASVLREYFAQCTHVNPIKINFIENTKDVKLDENIEITLYRIVQEAITNVLKHSDASLVEVELILESRRLKLQIRDNGKGFDAEEYQRHFDIDKMGLRGIKERVDILNGILEIQSSPAKGTKLNIILPLGEEGRK